MKLPVKRLVLGSAVAVAALGAGGIAYAAGNDPAPEQGYVTVEDGDTTPSPAPSKDCPDKGGQGGQGQGEQPSQPSEQNPAGNA
ncbi:hypothetical protein ABZX12_09180 [Kribbella sp. NPDC003505]|uniref:hypothetical protein n=1 Tax=Kribbella sp. NPDC003505 TaxID=3154448 RepID=UPI0033B50268